MKTGNTKRKIAEIVLGAAVGAAIAGTVGAVAGGLVGSQVAAHIPHPAETKRAPKKAEQVDDDPIVHAQLVACIFLVARRALHSRARRFGPIHVIETTTRSARSVRQERCLPRASAKVSAHLRDGVAYDEIATAARELGADLIIITHVRSGLSHVLLGSTAERVVRHAPCPVLTLRWATRD